jgi:hypothetical protein
MLTIDQKLTPNPNVVRTTLADGEVVFLHFETRRYFSLNETGSRIWELVEQDMTLEEIAEDLEHRFDVTLEDARRSVIQLAEQLAAEQLVEVTGG